MRRIEGRKLPVMWEGPVDNLFLHPMPHVADFLHSSLPFLTPNIITAVSTFFGILALCYWFFSMSFYWRILGAFFYGLYYFGDCLDGFYARRFDQVTVLGDFFDHGRDVVINFPCVLRNFCVLETHVSLLYSIVLLLMLVHVSIQEALYVHVLYQRPDESPSLSVFRVCFLRFFPEKCDADPEKWVPWTRFFSPGTFVVLTCFLVTCF
jgi:phosphatidylglycerophosphate synthase